MVDFTWQAADDPDWNRSAPSAGDGSHETKSSPHDDFIEGYIFGSTAFALERRHDGNPLTDAGRRQVRG